MCKISCKLYFYVKILQKGEVLLKLRLYIINSFNTFGNLISHRYTIIKNMEVIILLYVWRISNGNRRNIFEI